ncbi:MAG: hypothetical protein MK116_10625 [Phycisphaerales bacterium]|nr:hypothetical protein [Phycisphaerales bacterium]MCH2154090.1 hypothetical protein [Phycisphaerales bacterium]
MTHGRKPRRKPTKTAILVGSICFIISFAVIGIPGFLLLFWLKQVFPGLGALVLWLGPLPLVIAVMWLTLFLMERYEKATGTSLRTRSARRPQDDHGA